MLRTGLTHSLKPMSLRGKSKAKRRIGDMADGPVIFAGSDANAGNGRATSLVSGFG